MENEIDRIFREAMANQASDRLKEEDLIKIAKGLPPMSQSGKIRMVGQKLLNQGIVQVQGRKVDSKKTYITNGLVAINHLAELKHMNRQFGQAGVREYIKAINNRFTAEAEALKQKLNEQTNQSHT